MIDGVLLVDLRPDPPDIVAVHPEHAELPPGVACDQEPPEDAQPPDVGPGVAEAVPEHQAVARPLPHGDDAVAGTGRDVVPVQGEADKHPRALTVEDSDQTMGGGGEHMGEAVQESTHDDIIISGHSVDLRKIYISG